MDARGPSRTVINVDRKYDAAYLTLSCGHVVPRCPHTEHRLHSSEFCLTCGRLIQAAQGAMSIEEEFGLKRP